MTDADYSVTCEDGNACPSHAYSAHVFARRAVRVIEEVAPSGDPLFLYVAWQSVHSPREAPQAYIDAFNATVSDTRRRLFAGMVKALDEGVKNVTAALDAQGMLDDTLFVFTTDKCAAPDLACAFVVELTRSSGAVAGRPTALTKTGLATGRCEAPSEHYLRGVHVVSDLSLVQGSSGVMMCWMALFTFPTSFRAS